MHARLQSRIAGRKRTNAKRGEWNNILRRKLEKRGGDRCPRINTKNCAIIRHNIAEENVPPLRGD